MGIERFFNSLKNDFNIKEITPNYNSKIKSDNIFLDFNSIIHTISAKVCNIINLALIENIKNFNKCTKNDMTSKYLRILNLSNNFTKNIQSENEILKSYYKYFNDDMLDNLILNTISLYLQNLFKKFVNIKLIYIGIDGVPSKAKMVEQKNRAFMGEFESKFRKELIEKHKRILNKNKSDDCKLSYNKYNFLKNTINWSKSNIKPGTSFMIKLSKYLKSNEFKNDLIKENRLLTRNNIIISDHNENGEGEKKIMDYINNLQNNISGNVHIYSPDADMPLLTMILKKKNIKRYIIHVNQQKKLDLDKILDAYYDLVDIDILEDEIYNYMNTSLPKSNVIQDIVFIFSFFGNDFVPKIESIDVKKDIHYNLEIYKNYLVSSNNKSILEGLDKLTLNYNNFMKLLYKYQEKESEMVKRNYYSKKYKNFNYLTNEINIKLASKKYDYTSIDHNNINKFIYEYNNKKKNLPKLDSNFLKLIEYPNSVNNKKFKKQIENMDGYDLDLFKFENALDEYFINLNKKYDMPLGHPKLTFEEGKNKFYKDFFGNESLDNVIMSYLEAIIWILEYYFNDNLYQLWYFKYHKSPLIIDIIKYLEKDKDIFTKVKNKLKTYSIRSSENLLTPIEHYFYITPFDNKKTHLKYIRNYPSEIINKASKFIDYIKSNSKFKDLYPDIIPIVSNIINNKNNQDIDCRLQFFLNKCILSIIKPSILVNKLEFKDIFRKMVYQTNDLPNNMMKYKKLYGITRKFKYKKKYKQYKYIL